MRFDDIKVGSYFYSRGAKHIKLRYVLQDSSTREAVNSVELDSGSPAFIEDWEPVNLLKKETYNEEHAV